ncbi:MAG: leucine-rich repeat protein [Clostridia bacterium]|nr:leucine-rich repeat protein [Clostridia bacterium]
MIFDFTKRKSGGGTQPPTGTKTVTVTENGMTTEDVTDYASVQINTDVVGYKVYNDGATYLYISVNEVTRKLGLQMALYGSLYIDWGDGSTSTLSGTNGQTTKRASHEYARCGFYRIRCVFTPGVSSASCSFAKGSSSGSNIFSDVNGSVNSAYRCVLLAIENGSSKTAFENVFRYVYSLGYAHITDTSLGNAAFNGDSALSKIDIPNIVTIGDAVFSNCTGLGSVVIPASCTSIGASAFSGCTSLREIHFKSSTPPTLSNSNVFTSLSTSCKIYVPTGSLAAYTTATNYPSASVYTYEEE